MKIVRVFLALLIMAFAAQSCGRVASKDVRASKADSVLFDIGVVKDYEHMREVADSFEMAGDISALDANRWRGVSYYHQGQYRMAEICYRKALECEVTNVQDQLSYNKSARRLSELLLVRGDFEGSLRVAIPAVKKMDESGIGSDIDYAILLNTIGCCQLNLGQDKEANESFITARGHYANRWQSDTTSRGFQEAVDEYQGRIEIMRAVALQRLNKPKEASEAYQRFLKTDYSQTAHGRINANDYLVVAERYREAADNYRYLDETLEAMGMETTLDNIQLYYLPKYQSNAKAGRRDSAVVIGAHILSLLDSTITSHKNSAMAELATIYDTQGKEAEIARKEADLEHTRLVSTGIALVLLVVFFVVYTLHKRQTAHRLAAAHSKLEDAHAKFSPSSGCCS